MSVTLTPLGGLGRFGKNCLLVDNGDDGSVLIDCGVRFAGPELPGFDAGLPDLEHLARAKNLRAILVTHGHEDHIGALPFVVRDRPDLPLYATSFTTRFIHRRCARYDVKANVNTVAFGDVVEVAGLKVRFCAVSHSIPGAAALIIDSPVGTIVHSGDFRVDHDPILGPPTDLATLTAAGDNSVRCLLADSTGALTNDLGDDGVDDDDDNTSGVERSVKMALTPCFGTGGMLVVGLFASHLQRLALLATVCREQNRKLVLLGAGLHETFALAQAHGDAESGAALFADVVIDEGAAKALPRDRVCLAVTGTQGEWGAALSRLARGDGSLPFLLEAGDRVVFSARVIPGNEVKVQSVVDLLVDRGVDVVVGRKSPHVSGHGGQRDLRALLRACRPQTFVALHGTPQHLHAHGALARALGMGGDRVVGLRDGHSLVLDTDGHRHVASVPAHEPAVIDGEICDFPRGVVAARHQAGMGGVLVVVTRVAGDELVVIDVVGRGVFPHVTGDERAKLVEIVRERHSQGLSLDDDDASKAYRKPWKKGFRTPPLVAVVRSPA